MSEQMSEPLRVDIVSDVVCPWCIVGYKQLMAALAQTGLTAAIAWHPFELNPAMAAEGENLHEHMARKYGSTREQSAKVRARLTAVGAELDFRFVYSDDMRMVNTFLAHQLLHWAGLHQRRHALKLALFDAYFSQGRDVSDSAVLAETAEIVGLDRRDAVSVLADERHAGDVREAQRMWAEQGIQGVPAMLFDAQFLFVGAQGVERYVTIVRQVIDRRAA